jgi:hypothetical protein
MRNNEGTDHYEILLPLAPPARITRILLKEGHRKFVGLFISGCDGANPKQWTSRGVSLSTIGERKAAPERGPFIGGFVVVRCRGAIQPKSRVRFLPASPCSMQCRQAIRTLTNAPEIHWLTMVGATGIEPVTSALPS